MAAEIAKAAPSPEFFPDGVRIEILTWEWRHFLCLSRSTPRKYRFQGGLDRVRTIDVAGRILGPTERLGNDIRVSFMPLDLRRQFVKPRLDRVGWFTLPRPSADERGYGATLLLPDGDLTLVAVVLASGSKYLELRTADLGLDQLPIKEYALSVTIQERTSAGGGAG